MNRNEFFQKMRESAEEDGAMVIEIKLDQVAIDLRENIFEAPLLILSENPALSIIAEGAAMPAVLAVGWRQEAIKCSITSAFSDTVMPRCWETMRAYQDGASQGFPPGLMLNLRDALLPGHNMAEHGGLAEVKARLDAGVPPVSFGLWKNLDK